jgi:hypothetical protein
MTDRERTVFVSVEETPLVLSEVRRALPQLTRELRGRWPIQGAELENRMPVRRNPYTPTAVVAVACMGIAVRFALSAAQAAGTKVGDVMGREITKYVQRWIKRIGKTSAPMEKPSRSRKQTSPK